MATRYKRIDKHPFRFALARVQFHRREVTFTYEVITRSRTLCGIERWIKLNDVPPLAEILDSVSIDFPPVYGGFQR